MKADLCGKEREGYFRSVIGMWYTVWWRCPDVDNTGHWVEWSRGKPLQHGYYGANDEKVLAEHFTYFKDIGIDFLLLDDTNGHFNDKGCIAENINACYEAANKLGDKAPKLCIAGGSPLWMKRSFDEQETEIDIFLSYHMKYQDLSFFWKGKPLHIVYSDTWGFNWIDDKGRFTVRRATGRISEGKAYLQDVKEGLWGWVFDDQVPESEVIGVMPGWDTAHLGRGTLPISRENGELYIKMWLDAIKKNPEAIIISSWNDHAEETGIEAMQLSMDVNGRDIEKVDPRRYERITEGYVALKKGFLDGWLYRRESSGQVYRFSAASRLEKVSTVEDELVIVVPDDYFDWAGVETID